MRLNEIRTHKLFGLFDHVIPLNLDDRITIIHGPNGFGKTAVLRMIAGIFESKYSVLRTLPFQSVELRFDNGRVLRVTKSMPQDREAADDLEHSKVTLACPPNPPFDLPRLTRRSLREIPMRSVEEMIPGLHRVGPDQWLLDATGEVLQSDDLVERFGDELPIRVRPSEQPDWLAELKESLHVHFIRANRLELSERTMARAGRPLRASSVVARYAQELADQIQATLAQYAELSQSLDRSFPRRLVTTRSEATLSMEQIRSKLSDLERKRTQLTDAGLLDKEAQSHFEVASAIDESKADVLSVYIGDVERKLAVFDRLFAKIDLFRSILNRRFLFKTVSVNKNQGVVFRTAAGEALEPTNLSSGEQHEVVLLYQLLFEVKPKSLILIDEPELSFHILWQEQFLKDLTGITALSDLDVLIATHSPQIISDRWDLTVELKGPNGCSNTSRTTRSLTP
jgi:predicted ATP-binding protein involved in virulence